MAFDQTSFVVAVRESLEAFLIIGILAGMVTKLGSQHLRKWILAGAGAAAAFSVLLGTLVFTLLERIYGESSGETTEMLFAATASLIAVGILTYMVVWMYRHTITMVAGLRHHVRAALDAGRPALLALTAFIAVGREGLETVLFIGTQYGSVGASALVLAVLAGLAASATLAFLVFGGIVRLNMRKFFAASGILLIFFAAGILVYALHELAELGWIPETPQLWDLSGTWLDHKVAPVGILLNVVVGFRHNLNVLELCAYLAYAGVMLAWYLRGVLRRVPSDPHSGSTTPEGQAPA